MLKKQLKDILQYLIMRKTNNEYNFINYGRLSIYQIVQPKHKPNNPRFEDEQNQIWQTEIQDLVMAHTDGCEIWYVWTLLKKNLHLASENDVIEPSVKNVGNLFF